MRSDLSAILALAEVAFELKGYGALSLDDVLLAVISADALDRVEFTGWNPLLLALLKAKVTNQMSYDPRRLCLHGLIDKSPAPTPAQLDSRAVFYTKLRERLLGPLLDTAKSDHRHLHHQRQTRHRSMKTRH